MTPAEIHIAGQELAKRTRKAQGLPRTIRDREAVRRVVAVLCERRERAESRSAS